MYRRFSNVLCRSLGASLFLVLLVFMTGAGQAPPATTDPPASNNVPANTNPANHAIFPAGGQDANQQMQDQLKAYNWATQQTGWDPLKAYDVLVQKGYVAEQTAQQAQGGAVKGAARGALAGVAIGAIAGDAGKGAAIGAVAGGLTGGMRSNRTQQAAQASAQQAVDAFNQQFAVWDKNYMAAMQGYGYTIQ